MKELPVHPYGPCISIEEFRSRQRRKRLIEQPGAHRPGCHTSNKTRGYTGSHSYTPQTSTHWGRYGQRTYDPRGCKETFQASPEFFTG
ncbi:unnamed protein product [Pleuronectes platessa]|uniref:Uncharacterized protein n=1 Tax=Pleuronectes platessa TaxID=8262 RepID=A0A9N7YNS3_PLEPL|nr:unnamed protein product [Pleuronectes platessa]